MCHGTEVTGRIIEHNLLVVLRTWGPIVRVVIVVLEHVVRSLWRRQHVESVGLVLRSRGMARVGTSYNVGDCVTTILRSRTGVVRS